MKDGMLGGRLSGNYQGKKVETRKRTTYLKISRKLKIKDKRSLVNDKNNDGSARVRYQLK